MDLLLCFRVDLSFCFQPKKKVHPEGWTGNDLKAIDQ